MVHPAFYHKIGLTINPLAKHEVDHCVANNPSPRFLLAPTGLLLLDRCVYVPDYQPDRGNLCTRALQEKHNHPTAGHFGFNKTLELLRCDYVWPSMRIKCKKYVSQCMLCARNKPSRHCPTDSFSLFRFQSIHGTPSAWTLSSNFRPLMDIQPFSSLLIDYRRKAYSSPQQTVSCL